MRKPTMLAGLCAILPLALAACGGAAEAPAAAATGDAATRPYMPRPFDQYLERMHAQGLVHERNETLSRSYRGSLRDHAEYQNLPPIQVFDNLHYVGPGFVSVWLLATSDGLVLFDGAEEPYVDPIVERIRAAGFSPDDIRYILITHGHMDHFGGVAKLQQASGARVGALEEDWQLIEKAAGTPQDPGEPVNEIVKRDLVLEEGTDLTVGDTTIRIYHMPGHTAGSPTYEFTVYDNGTPHKAMLVGGPSQRGGVEGASQFVSTVDRLIAEHPDVEVPIDVHSWQSTYPIMGIFERALRLAYRQPGDPHPFVDNVGWRIWLRDAKAGAAKYLAEQQAAGAEGESDSEE